MHEYSICTRIVDAVLEEMSRLHPPPRRLHKIRIVVGRLHQIVPDYLATAYEMLTRDTPAEGSEMELDVRPVTARCRACTWEGPIEPPFFRCGGCEAFEVDVTGGKELYLEHLQVEQDED